MTSDPLDFYMSPWAYNRNDDKHDNAKYAPDNMHPATYPCKRNESGFSYSHKPEWNVFMS